mgnify:CR=1 FL=1
MKILYLCTRPEAQNNGGSVVAGRNLCAIRQIVGEESVEVCYLPKPTWKTVGRSLVTLSSYGLDRAYEDEMWRLIIILYLSKVRYWVDL